MAISFTELKNTYAKLSQNLTSTNTSLAGDLMNREQRYLLQQYPLNERTFSQTTVGTQALTATASLVTGAVSLTLTAPWAYHTTQSTITFSGGDTRMANFTRNSTSVTWGVGLSENANAAISVGGLQFYPLPPDYSKIKTATVTQGNLMWTPSEILTRPDWDKMNTFPYYSDIPNNYYIYNNQIGIWPIPSTTGNTLTVNYKCRIPDLSLEDYSTGTVAVTQGSTTITGTGTAWTPTTNIPSESRWIKIAQTAGDNLWYQISTVNSATSITLTQPYQGITVSGGTYILGQMPILPEDFHDILVDKALMYYWNTKVKNPEAYAMAKDDYDRKLGYLNEYAGNKTISVDLRQGPLGRNPNLFPQNIGL